MSQGLPSTPPWLREVQQEVAQALVELQRSRSDNRPALEHVRQQLQDQQRGWLQTLGQPNLPASVRSGVQAEYDKADARITAIEIQLGEIDAVDTQFASLADEAAVLERIDRLGEILAGESATLINYELSFHIDRIDCAPSGEVSLRLCKLGVLTEAVEIFAENGPSPTEPLLSEHAAQTGKPDRRHGPRRRARHKASELDLNALDDDLDRREFAADTKRFAILGPEWFETITLQSPDHRCWSERHAEEVFLRRLETGRTYDQLAEDFGVSRPTISAAIHRYREQHPHAAAALNLPRKKRQVKFKVEEFGAEARQLWEAGATKLKLAERFNCSPPIIDKALAWASAQDGRPLPTRASRSETHAREAKRLHGQGRSLDEISLEMGISVSTARKYLKLAFRAEGEEMPDLRTREYRRQPAACE